MTMGYSRLWGRRWKQWCGEVVVASLRPRTVGGQQVEMEGAESSDGRRTHGEEEDRVLTHGRRGRVISQRPVT
jgi:hypothetical protein